ncbi:MAG: NUDIX hydrolase [Candidatus Caldarchaeum sp.]|nr:NUDIX hydrolase [Candidatus Caldarchaeum sp.]
MFEVRESDVIYEGVLFDLKRVVLASDGLEMVREVVVHPGAVAIVPFVDDDRVVLVEQYRYAADRWLLEVPAGTIEDESPEICAARELEEETGFRAKSLKKIAAFYLAPGYSTELLHVFIAGDLEPSRPAPEQDERIRTHVFGFAETLEMVKNGKIVDAKTIAALLMVDKFYCRR